jgi:hypothetical protein
MELPELATKEIAARMAYNKLEALRAAGAPEEEASPGDENTPAETSGLAFATGRFNENMTMYGGIPISSDVKIFTYGVRTNYKSDMKLPEDGKGFRADTVHKFKLANTPCFYAREGGEITMMVLPMDSGFTGRVYCVINRSGRTTNGRAEQVNLVHTIAAARNVSWLTRDSNTDAPPASEYLAGEVYEMDVNNGIIRRIVTAGSGNGHKDFLELTPGGGWHKVKSATDDYMTLDNANEDIIPVEASTVVYVLSDDGKSYRAGWMSDITDGSEIRAFTIKTSEIAQYVTVKPN